ncbi:MAG: alpha-amylase family glycosyl hydrolase [Bacteroidota bacterium]
MLRLIALVPLLAGCAVSTPIAQPSDPSPEDPPASVTSASMTAPTPSDAERAQGYALRGDSTVFVFDPAPYGIAAPERVVVTGAFRGWSTDMDDPAWALTEADGLWMLAVANPEFAEIGPSAPFKFRVDAGRWLDPPASAPNVEGGNLVFLYGVTPARLVAGLRGEQSVWVEVTGTARPTDPAAYRIVRWDGTEIPVATVIPNGAATALLVPGHGTTEADPFEPDLRPTRLETNQVHYVEVTAPDQPRPLRSMARFDGLWRDLADAGFLGARIVDTCPGCAALNLATEVRLFAPRADSVTVHFYRDRTGPAFANEPMTRTATGVWEWRGEGLTPGAGDWYDFSVFGPDGPGSHFTNQTGDTVSDPYALVSDDSWGRARIWQDRFDPPQPVRGGRPAMEDVVAYEVHLQDFTDRLPVGAGAGALEMFALPGLTNSHGAPIGLDYLVDLGINTVHLMPVQEYLHYPDEAWQAAFADDPFMQEQGVARENYQWGYRTTHSLAVESRFRSEGDEPGRERERFRDLVDALHERGMAVLIDVVFNHTGEDMEGQLQTLTFNGIDKHYYYRLDAEGNHIGVFGNEVKYENRPMTQRWLLDQLRHYVEVFGVDGFRIDLAGQTDEQTLRWIQAELGEDVLIYGEPWIGSNDPDYEANPDWDWYKIDSPITFFQDDARNAFKGSPSDHPSPDPATRGFAGGDTEVREDAMRGIANDYPEEPTPNAGINYLDIHDNWALADRFATCETGECAWDGRAGVREAEMRLAAAILTTSLGPIVIHGGTEIAKSKGVAPLPETIGGEQVLTAMSIAPIYIKGRGDTYNLRTANQYDWEHVGWADGPVDYPGMYDWWKSLIALRMSEAGEVLRIGTEVPEGHVVFHDHDDPHVLVYTIGDRFHVTLNTGGEAVEIGPRSLPGDGWVLRAMSSESGVNISPTDESVQRFRTTGEITEQTLGPKGVAIWVRE